MSKISPLEFAEILLRYTELPTDKRIKLAKKLENKMDAYSRTISFDEFKKFNSFMNNLEDFRLALQFHTQAHQAISVKEFQRAVKIASGSELDPIIVEVIFEIFDENKDGHLSYQEFIAVVRTRLKRGLNVTLL
jgi:calcium uptake protein 3, mitochondrial